MDEAEETRPMDETSDDDDGQGVTVKTWAPWDGSEDTDASLTRVHPSQCDNDIRRWGDFDAAQPRPYSIPDPFDDNEPWTPSGMRLGQMKDFENLVASSHAWPPRKRRKVIAAVDDGLVAIFDVVARADYVPPLDLDEAACSCCRCSPFLGENERRCDVLRVVPRVGNNQEGAATAVSLRWVDVAANYAVASTSRL